ncbi:TetR/AcrR family transcriptional regulator [Hyphomicrobium methylovorum]|uniref:TetR/AcrR family transcriptional regulator n=1 Tax=Hyphomicrobium methylovorum TaxID=84 RepID=UPI001FE3F4FB|nr:TetR/AcrR family transcriptional regulator [Hyphomicrobium methylovorum]
MWNYFHDGRKRHVISMGRRSAHSPEELRQLILDASKTIVEQNGISGLSAREIARIIGYSPGTLYNIFENLDDVLLSMQIQLLGRSVDHLHSVELGSDSEENVEALIQAYIDFALSNRHMWNVLFAHTLPATFTIPVSFTDHLNSLSDILRRALKPIDPNATDSELDLTAHSLFAAVHGMTAIAASGKSAILTPLTARSYAKQLSSTFLRGMRSRPA